MCCTTGGPSQRQRFDNGSESPEEASVRFTVEHAPLGPTNITVELLSHGKHKHGPEVDAIRAHVAHLDSAGQLP